MPLVFPEILTLVPLYVKVVKVEMGSTWVTLVRLSYYNVLVTKISFVTSSISQYTFALLYIVGTDYGVPGGWFAGGGASSLR